jgi:hypothetical protein
MSADLATVIILLGIPALYIVFWIALIAIAVCAAVTLP